MDKNIINTRFIEAINMLLDKDNSLSKGDLASALSIKPAKFSEILNGRMKAGSYMQVHPLNGILVPLNRL